MEVTNTFRNTIQFIKGKFQWTNNLNGKWVICVEDMEITVRSEVRVTRKHIRTVKGKTIVVLWSGSYKFDTPDSIFEGMDALSPYLINDTDKKPFHCMIVLGEHEYKQNIPKTFYDPHTHKLKSKALRKARLKAKTIGVSTKRYHTSNYGYNPISRKKSSSVPSSTVTMTTSKKKSKKQETFVLYSDSNYQNMASVREEQLNPSKRIEGTHKQFYLKFQSRMALLIERDENHVMERAPMLGPAPF
ncbi:MAG: hypothetical protein ACTSUE_09145, partial [Promethearchaeota archaeon]